MHHVLQFTQNNWLTPYLRERKESNVLDQFDFSNYPEFHELYSEENKRVEKSLYVWGQSCTALLPLLSILRLIMPKKLTNYQLTLYDCHDLIDFFFS